MHRINSNFRLSFWNGNIFRDIPLISIQLPRIYWGAFKGLAGAVCGTTLQTIRATNFRWGRFMPKKLFQNHIRARKQFQFWWCRIRYHCGNWKSEQYLECDHSIDYLLATVTTVKQLRYWKNGRFKEDISLGFGLLEISSSSLAKSWGIGHTLLAISEN